MKTVAEMSEREQIERLVRQRNALWRLIDELIRKHGSGDERTDFLKEEDLPTADCEIEDGLIVVCVSNTLDNLSSVRFDIDELADASEKVTGNTYVIEGRNHQVGETNPDALGGAFEPYIHAPGGWWVGEMSNGEAEP